MGINALLHECGQKKNISIILAELSIKTPS